MTAQNSAAHLNLTLATGCCDRTQITVI